MILRELHPSDFYKRFNKRLMRSNVVLASQFQSYSICTEFALRWFLEKYKYKFFNSIYVEGRHSFDEFRKFSTIDEQLMRANPILAMIPNINLEHNRDWIDSNPEIPMLLRRTKMDGTFFNDLEKDLHLQIILKTILMTFQYKLRFDTRAEQLDNLEKIKLKHRAGWTETRELVLDIHVPREIMAQIAVDAGFKINQDLDIEDPFAFLKYLNSHSYITFVYKLRCVNNRNEFFIKMPNCTAHIKSNMPSADEGERKDHTVTNFTIDFDIEVEMTAPYAFTYFSQEAQPYITTNPITTDEKIAVMMGIKTEFPPVDEHGWELFSTTEYMVDEEDLKNDLIIDFNEYLKGTTLQEIIHYTNSIRISPEAFVNFKLFNNGLDMPYRMDWNCMKCIIPNAKNVTTVIGVYCDMQYIHNFQLQIKETIKDRIY